MTAPSQEEARRLSGALLERGLAACVNMLPGVESMYTWEGRVETAQEVLMMIKVSGRNLSKFNMTTVVPKVVVIMMV